MKKFSKTVSFENTDKENDGNKWKMCRQYSLKKIIMSYNFDVNKIWFWKLPNAILNCIFYNCYLFQMVSYLAVWNCEEMRVI